MQRTVGIFGAGQLAKMLGEAATAMGVRHLVYAGSSEECAVGFASASMLGGPSEKGALETFLGSVDVATFESEFFPLEAVREVAGSRAELLLRPSLASMEVLSDKAAQKRLLEEMKVSTAAAAFFAPADKPADAVRAARKRFGDRFVMKWGRGGYDGKGLCFGSEADARMEAFVAEGFQRKGEVYAEEMVAFRREWALVLARGADGATSAYPLLALDNSGGVCRSVMGPGSRLGVSAEKEIEVRGWGERLAKRLDYVGVLALELFETREGVFLVNEIAPRVHNSGHITQDAALVSQFENHWRALLGLPLGNGEMAPAFAMRNALGPAGCSASVTVPRPGPDYRVHWYGKGGRPGRKLGHWNAVSYGKESPEDLLRRLNAAHDAWVKENAR